MGHFPNNRATEKNSVESRAPPEARLVGGRYPSPRATSGIKKSYNVRVTSDKPSVWLPPCRYGGGNQAYHYHHFAAISPLRYSTFSTSAVYRTPNYSPVKVTVIRLKRLSALILIPHYVPYFKLFSLVFSEFPTRRNDSIPDSTDSRLERNSVDP